MKEVVSTIFLHSIIITVSNRRGLSWTPRHITVEQERVLRSFWCQQKTDLGWIHYSFLIYLYVLTHKNKGKKTNKQKSKGPWLWPWIVFLLIANILHPCFIICTVEAILCSWYTCISKQDSEAYEISCQVSAYGSLKIKVKSNW